MYYKFKSLILFFAKIFSVFPKPVLKILYNLIEPFSGLFFVFLRFVIVRNLCRSVGDNVFIGNYVELRCPENLTLGSNVSINKNCYLDASGGISIGNDVSIAHQTSLVSFDHGWSDHSLPIRKNPLNYSRIQIDDDVWVGAGVRILAGASLGSRCIVASGAVVIGKEYQEGVLLAGVPAKTKKNIK